MDNEEKYKKLIHAIKVLRDMKPHDEYLENWIKENAPEIAETEDERIRKWCISHFRECFRVTKDNVEYKEYLNNKVIPWIEKQDPKKHQDELDAAYKTADKVQYHRGYEAAWKEMGERKPPMQNGITINGVEYELIEDREDDECERCALSDICHDARKEVICNPIFGDLSISHRFAMRK